MKFTHNFTESYDPFGIIHKMRVENKSTPYVHTHMPKIEQLINETEWVDNTLQEAKE